MTARRFVALALLAATVAGGAGGCAYVDVKQREMIFRVERDGSSTPADYGMAFEDVWLTVPGDGGERIHGWWIPAARADAPAVLYLHGTRWSLSRNLFRISRWNRLGFSVLAVDYRGFGRSDGDLPSEEQTYVDAQTAWEYLRTRVPPGTPRLAYGHSLGGAVAIELATRNDDLAGLIVESSFTSIADMVARSEYAYLPVSLVLTQRYESIAKVGALRTPVVFIHGTADRYVPPEMSERLYAAAASPKRLVLIEGGSHSNSSGTDFVRWGGAIHELTNGALRAELRQRDSVGCAPAVC